MKVNTNIFISYFAAFVSQQVIECKILVEDLVRWCERIK